jgi:hypothetical protein
MPSPRLPRKHSIRPCLCSFYIAHNCRSRKQKCKAVLTAHGEHSEESKRSSQNASSYCIQHDQHQARRGRGAGRDRFTQSQDEFTTPTVSVVRVSSLRVVRLRKALSELPRLCIAVDCYALSPASCSSNPGAHTIARGARISSRGEGHATLHSQYQHGITLAVPRGARGR